MKHYPKEQIEEDKEWLSIIWVGVFFIPYIFIPPCFAPDELTYNGALIAWIISSLIGWGFYWFIKRTAMAIYRVYIKKGIM